MHICPVEISAALMLFKDGVPYVRATWCHHVRSLKERYNEWKGVETASQDETTRQGIEEALEVTELDSEESSSGCVQEQRPSGCGCCDDKAIVR